MSTGESWVQGIGNIQLSKIRAPHVRWLCWLRYLLKTCGLLKSRMVRATDHVCSICWATDELFSRVWKNLDVDTHTCMYHHASVNRHIDILSIYLSIYRSIYIYLSMYIYIIHLKISMKSYQNIFKQITLTHLKTLALGCTGYVYSPSPLWQAPGLTWLLLPQLWCFAKPPEATGAMSWKWSILLDD